MSSEALMSVIQKAQEKESMGDLSGAIDCYQKWMDTEADKGEHYHIALFNLGTLLRADGKLTQAIDCFREALRVKPDFHQATVNLGLALEKNGNRLDALAVWQKALPPIDIQTKLLNHCGRVYEGAKLYDEAEEYLLRSLRMAPDQPDVIQHYLHIRQKKCKWPIIDAESGLSEEALLKACGPLGILAMTDDPDLQLQVISSWVDRKVNRSFVRLAPLGGYKHDKIRIGYLSCDFRWHAVSILTAELFELHNRERFEVYAVDYSTDDGGSMRKRVLSAMDHCLSVQQLSDEDAAKLIRLHEIDILIDLTGLTSEGRPGILSYKPAPLQISYLGYVGSSSMTEVDYMLADRFVFPDELRSSFTEKPLYLPDVYQVNDSKREIGLLPTRSSCGLPEPGFVYCSFNGSYKITPEVYDVWMRILKRVPSSVLWLVADNEAAKMNLRAEAQKRDVSPGRIHFAGKVPPAEYLARLQIADLMLDTSPYNAGTTASDALWAGLPILTCPGRCFASRMAGSILNSVGLPELIAGNWTDYESIAVRLAGDASELQRHRMHLKAVAKHSPLFDSEKFVRNLENTLEEVLCLENGIRKNPSRNEELKTESESTGDVCDLVTVAEGDAKVNEPVTKSNIKEKRGSVRLRRDARIYMIANSQETLSKVFGGFLLLDNMLNTRPDWREYWAIRNYLLSNNLEDGRMYGFLSPEFSSNTGLIYTDAMHFIRSCDEEVDVITFSPQPDMSCFFLNIFEQQNTFDAGFTAVAESFFAHLGVKINMSSLIMDSRHTVFSNYFVAKSSFWNDWFEMCEKLYDICESGGTKLSEDLCAQASHGRGTQRKVFLIERMASFMLLSQKWRVQPYNTFKCAWSGTLLGNYKTEAVMSDALKVAYNEIKHKDYIWAFSTLRNQILTP
ncbi:MAG: tetratricopeptide repeat protein [Planctomycetes bacterium]|nr:tetratricopeptide repeat protein [Planctomycetota bacterium]